MKIADLRIKEPKLMDEINAINKELGELYKESIKEGFVWDCVEKDWYKGE